MKTLIIVFVLLTSLVANAQTDTETGTDPMGPPTMGQPEYQMDGEMKRNDNLTPNPQVPDETPVVKQKQEKETQTGPFKNGEYQFWDPNKENSDR
jgi:hypothetical protein